MIEFALLFGLGFLTAALLAMMLAPAIQRRVVSYTETRLKATMPLSPQEVRAQRDMARAVFAAEQSKTQQELLQEREKRVALQVANEAHGREAARMAGESADQQQRISDLTTEVEGLRTSLQAMETRAAELQAQVTAQEAEISKRLAEMEDLRRQLNKAQADRDNLKIDLAARNAQFESDRYRSQSMREERDGLRREVKLLTNRAKEAEQRLEQEEHKALRLSDRLAREQAGAADKESVIERRQLEIARLRDKLKTVSAETREARKQLKTVPGEPKVSTDARQKSKPANLVDSRLTMEDLPEMQDEIRHQAAALSDRLIKSRSATHDQALREELASVAARMVAVTALEEGASSPLHDLVKRAVEENGPHPSLADRVLELLPEQR